MQLYRIVNRRGRLFSKYKSSVSCFESLHRRLKFGSSINFSHPYNYPYIWSLSDGSESSTHWKLHLSVTRTHGSRTLAIHSPEWRTLRAKILLRDNLTCSSCGYLSPYSHGRSMVVDHIDGNASNNDPSNLRIHCPPCEAIRHCDFAGLQKWLVVGESSMEQVEIVRKTREIFEKTGVIPHPKRIDLSVKQVDIGVLDFANMMLRTPWEYLPKEFRRLRGFFTMDSSDRFRDTMLPRNLVTVEPSGDSTKALFNKSDRKAAEIAACETGLPSISYSEESHESSQVFLDSLLPSKTPNTQVAWICVRSAKFEDKFPDLNALFSAWNKIRAKRLITLPEVDELAKQFNIFSGKWLVFVSSDKVDNLWGRIVESTLAGTLGNSAKVSPRNEKDPGSNHVICVCNSDYRSIEEVNRVRDGLRQLGVKERISYKPDIYTYWGIYQGNSWGIPASLYFS